MVTGAIKTTAELQDIFDSGSEFGEVVIIYCVDVSYGRALLTPVKFDTMTVVTHKTYDCGEVVPFVAGITGEFDLYNYGLDGGEYSTHSKSRLFINRMHANNYMGRFK